MEISRVNASYAMERAKSAQCQQANVEVASDAQNGPEVRGWNCCWGRCRWERARRMRRVCLRYFVVEGSVFGPRPFESCAGRAKGRNRSAGVGGPNVGENEAEGCKR